MCDSVLNLQFFCTMTSQCRVEMWNGKDRWESAQVSSYCYTWRGMEQSKIQYLWIDTIDPVAYGLDELQKRTRKREQHAFGEKQEQQNEIQ